MFRRLLSFLSDTLWVIQIRDGSVEVTKGKIPHRFVMECREELEGEGVTEGEIRGVRRSGYTGLEFSKNIPSQLHQRLRNIWVECDR